VGHIIGYGELLAEAADDSGEEEVAHAARSISVSGRGLYDFIEENFATLTSAVDSTQVRALRVTTQGLIEKILEAASLNSTVQAGDALVADLERIKHAARQLAMTRELGLCELPFGEGVTVP